MHLLTYLVNTYLVFLQTGNYVCPLTEFRSILQYIDLHIFIDKLQVAKTEFTSFLLSC